MKLAKRRSDRSGRATLFSPGRPSVAGRDERRRFWAAIAVGLESVDAALAAGVPPAIGTRWFRTAGGILPAMFGRSAKPLSGRYLSFAEREEIALLRAQGYSKQEVARRLGRAASTISRELRRNAAAWSTAPQQRNGMPNEPLVGQNRESLRRMRPCEPMWRSDWLASSSLRAALLWPARPCPGKAVDMDRGRIVDGPVRGARSRSLADSRSISRTMRPCALAMKPSTKRCSFKDEARCGAS